MHYSVLDYVADLLVVAGRPAAAMFSSEGLVAKLRESMYSAVIL